MMKSKEQVEQINKTIEIIEKVLTALTIIRDNDVTEVQVLRDLDLDPSTFRRLCYDNDWLSRTKNKDEEYLEFRKKFQEAVPTLDWTEDLFCAIVGLPRTTASCGKIPTDVRGSVMRALDSLTASEQGVIRALYQDRKNLDQIGQDMGLTSERVRQIRQTAFIKLRNPNRMSYIVFGDGYYINKRKLEAELEAQYAIKKCNEELERLETIINVRRGVLNSLHYTETDRLLDRDVAVLDLSTRAYNCLYRQGIRTIRELIALSETQLRGIRNLGCKSAAEIISILEQNGYYLRGE